ncbi:cold shock CspA family protein [Paraburkholderia sp. RAU6.4a]|uniref:cold shock domain-containing protein n=1 Tax=Paraburkholderia sp. RAU6.4a TaxID=2991067 RepID=UPI003D1DD5C9
MKAYARGTVENYDDRGGYGFIIPDEPADGEEKLIVHRRSLRSVALVLRSGDRVVYQKESVPRGTLATDVHQEVPDETSESSETRDGTIATIETSLSCGTIRDSAGATIFFSFAELLDKDASPQPGDRVTFTVVKNELGFQARDLSLDTSVQAESRGTDREPVAPKAAAEILAQAILARDNRQFAEAERLYERGLEKFPTVQLATSYAAMQKNRNRRAEAMRIYQKCIALFPNNSKLRDDAGNLAYSMGDSNLALRYFEEGLRLARQNETANEGIFLLAIARIYIKKGTHLDLKKALETYQAAERVLAHSKTGKQALPRSDLLAMQVASVRIQHHRGNVAFEFIQKAGFKVLRAQLFDQATAGADFVVEVDRPELLESYGIAGGLLIRCFFKSDITRSDLEGIDRVAKIEGESGLVDEQVAIVIVSSLPETLQSTLFRRIEDRTRSVPAIVPLTQSELETSLDAMATLRTVLDQWLYRRDLFALNSPVSGRRFFGREKPLAELRDAISTGTAAGIFGLRKVGKTSILKEVERRGTEAGDIVLYVDLLRVPADVANTRWLYWKLGAELHRSSIKVGLKGVKWRIGQAFPDFLDVPADFPIATAFDSDLTQALKAIEQSASSPKPKIVLMLDEIERLLPNGLGKEGFGGFFDFFSYIRGVSQESADFVPIVTGANAAIAEVSQFDRKDNPVFNFFREIYLPLLQPKELTTMVQVLGRGMGINIPANACELIFRLTGGHPFFTRQLCSFLSEQHTQRPLNVRPEMIESLTDRYLEVAGKDFQEVLDRFSRDYPDELDACVAIVEAGGTLPIKELVKKSGDSRVNLRHLLGYQIVKLMDDNASISIELLRRWLQLGQGITRG